MYLPISIHTYLDAIAGKLRRVGRHMTLGGVEHVRHADACSNKVLLMGKTFRWGVSEGRGRFYRCPTSKTEWLGNVEHAFALELCF